MNEIKNTQSEEEILISEDITMDLPFVVVATDVFLTIVALLPYEMIFKSQWIFIASNKMYCKLPFAYCLCVYHYRLNSIKLHNLERLNSEIDFKSYKHKVLHIL